MSYRCSMCHKYFRDILDLVNHTKESHKTSFNYVIIQYINSKVKRLESFLNKDTKYILSFDLPNIIDRLVKLEVRADDLDNHTIPQLFSEVKRKHVEIDTLGTEGKVYTSDESITLLQKELAGIKSFLFTLEAEGTNLPFVPFGPSSDKRTKEYLLWATHKDKRKGTKKVHTGYGVDHQELMNELGPILERRKYELM